MWYSKRERMFLISWGAEGDISRFVGRLFELVYLPELFFATGVCC